MSKYVITFLAAAALSSAQQVAPTAPQHDPAKRFHKLDKNGDGRLSLSEFSAHGKNAAHREKRFHKLDANNDNFLSLDEFAAGRTTPAK